MQPLLFTELDTMLRYFLDIEEKMEKPDYFYNPALSTREVLRISFELIENSIMNSYQSVGNPAASRKQLVNVWIRLLKSLLR